MNKIIKKFTPLFIVVTMILSMIPNQFSLTTSAKSVPEGFVYTNGTQFMCDGSPYYYGGTNCYYLIYKSKSEVDNVMEDAADMGLKVIRTWGHLDVGTKTDRVTADGYPVFENNNDSTGEKDGVYFQYFDADLNTPVVNEGVDGLQRLDYAIAKAESEDIKLLITFTNYWEAFGGMGQYVKWAKEAGIASNLVNDDFYTNETLKKWYKDYIKTLLNHTNPYTGRKLKDEPAVFAWELSNEPRCKTDEGCKEDILYNWAKEMSEYVKTIDPNHMVSIGDEGFYNLPYNSVKESTCSYIWYGAEGVDFEKLMTIDTVDFGTPHVYVDQWGMKFTGDGIDDLLWFKKHAETTKANNKPVILEEFGIKDKLLRDAEFMQWYDLLEGNTYEGIEYAGSNYWMIASYMDNSELYADYDGYTVYGPADVAITASTRDIIVNHTETMNRKNIANFVTPSQLNFDRDNQSDILVNATMKIGRISGLLCDTEEMLNGRDYVINDNIICISKDFLASKELSEYKFKVLTTDGNKPIFYVNVFDNSIPDPELSVYSINVDKNPNYCADIKIETNANGSEFRGIKNGADSLVAGIDYIISGNQITIKKSYLTTLEEGNVALTFDFYEGIDRKLTLCITDSSGKNEFDTFDSYVSEDDLKKAYIVNSNGNEVSLSLEDKNGSQALAFEYNVGNPSYCGVNKALKIKDFLGYTGIQLWMEGDGSGNVATIQFRDKADNYWETNIKLNFTAARTIQIPFSDFVAPSWQSGSLAPDVSAINQLSIYVGAESAKTKGIIYIDDIIAYKDGEEINYPHILDPTKEYNINSPTDLITNVMFYGNSLKSITYNQTTLVQGSDYSINGGQIRINNVFLETLLESGCYQLLYTFSDGSTDILNINVKGADVDPSIPSVEGEINVDLFNNLNPSDYVRNGNGNMISVTASSGRAKINYIVGNPDYAGFTKQLGSMDWTAGEKIMIDISNDVAGRDFVFQICDKNGNYFETRKNIESGDYSITIDLSELQSPQWASVSTPDFSGVTEYSVYIEKGSAVSGSGVIYLDNIIVR